MQAITAFRTLLLSTLTTLTITGCAVDEPASSTTSESTLDEQAFDGIADQDAIANPMLEAAPVHAGRESAPRLFCQITAHRGDLITWTCEASSRLLCPDTMSGSCAIVTDCDAFAAARAETGEAVSCPE